MLVLPAILLVPRIIPPMSGRFVRLTPKPGKWHQFDLLVALQIGLSAS